MLIFKPGKFPATNGKWYELTADDLTKTAQVYDPAKKKAAIVVGHPTNDSPAYGFIDALKFAGNQLVGKPNSVVPGFVEFAENVWQGASPMFYAPDSPHNPVPGSYYLRHIGLTNFPASNLPLDFKAGENVAFAEGEQDGLIEFSEWTDRTVAALFRGMRDFFIDQFGLETADKVIPEFYINDLQMEAMRPMGNENPGFSEATDPAFAERQRQLEAREAAITRREMVAFCEGLLGEGKHFNKDLAVEILVGAPTDGAIAFGEGDGAVSGNLQELFKKFLEGLPKTVEFGEVAPGKDVVQDPAPGSSDLDKAREKAAAGYEQHWKG